MIALADVMTVVVFTGLACAGTFAVAYQLGYAHGRLREIDGRDGGPGFEEIDRAADEYTPARGATPR